MATQRLDTRTQAWLRRHSLTQSAGNRLSNHMFGAPLMEALGHLHSVHLTPYGNTRHGLYRELARILAAEEQFKSVAHLFTEQAR